MTPKQKDATWSAVQDRQPLPPYLLRVEGKPKMPSPGHTPVLKRGEPQGINPRILLLDLSASEPTKPGPQVITAVPVRYEEESNNEYDEVTIRSQVATEPGANIEVEVAH